MSELANNEKNPFEGWTVLEEAASLVGRDYKTIRSWANNGFITCYRVGQKIRLVNVEEVRRFSNNRAHYPPRRG